MIPRPLVVLNRKYRHNVAIHGGFLQAASTAGVDPVFYGPYTAGITSPVVPFLDSRRSLAEVADEHGCNLVILYRAGSGDLHWTRRHIDAVTLPVVLVDVDFCFRRGKVDLADHVDLHLLRHPSDVEHSPCDERGRLPFSIDPKLYAFGGPRGRAKKLCFSGTYNSPNYRVRTRAIRMMHPVRGGRLVADKQAAFYRKHLAGLTGSCVWHYLNAKHFEIPATGTVLFTNGHNAVEDYLPKNTYVTYRDDCSDLPDFLEMVCRNHKAWGLRAAEAAAHVRKHHNHTVRWIELLNKINSHLGTDFRGANRTHS